MNRNEFLRGISGCCAAVASLQVAKASVVPRTDAVVTQSRGAREGTPIDQRVSFAMRWAKRMLDNMDRELGEPTRSDFCMPTAAPVSRARSPNSNRRQLGLMPSLQV